MQTKTSFKQQKKESRHNKGSPPGQKRVLSTPKTYSQQK